ncbi:unnamed protein product [Schistosoma turkestanicum]|nr:unnamed protein product [Schistosoma turkestanicum]
MGLHNRDQIFTDLLLYFPGRSARSLQARFKTLRKWAKLWYNLREQVTGRLEDSVSCDSSLPSEQNVLLYSPFATQFVNQLKSAGVPDPETEAYRILTTCKISKDRVKSSNYSWSNKGWNPNPIDSDFIQLLDDLVSGVLFQQHTSPHNDSNQTNIISHSTQSNNPGEQEQNNEVNETQKNATLEISEPNALFRQLTSSESKWIIHQTQIKHVLVGPVRRYLTIMSGNRVPNTMHGSSSVFMQHRNSISITNRCKENRASLLLRKEHLFWMTLDQVMCDPKVKSSLQQINKISMLRTAAPFIARRMVSHLKNKSFTQTVYQQRKELKIMNYSNSLKRKSERCTKNLRKRIFEKHSGKKQNNLESCHNQTKQSITADDSLTTCSLENSTSTVVATSSDETMITMSNTTIANNSTITTTTTTTTRTIDAVSTTSYTTTTDRIGSTSSPYNTTIEKYSIKLTETKQKLLLQIHGLLKAFRRKKYNCSSAYALSTNIWSRRMNAVEAKVSSQERYIPPVIRGLPSEISILLFQQPNLINTRCLEIARSCLLNGLNMHINKTNLSKGTDSVNKCTTIDQSVTHTTSSFNTIDSQSIQPKRVRILPPNYATILGFKSLLMNLSTLLEKEKGKFSQFTELRQLFCAFPGQTITDEEFERKLEEAKSSTLFAHPILNTAHILLSAKYTNFINRSLALFLWPALLASIPAKSFMENAKCHWKDAYEHSITKYPQPNDNEIIETQNDDTIVRVNEFKRKRQRKNYPDRIPNKRLKRNHNYKALLNFHWTRYGWANRTNSSVTFTITGKNDELLSITLPSEIRILYSCGFKPDSFLNLRK